MANWFTINRPPPPPHYLTPAYSTQKKVIKGENGKEGETCVVEKKGEERKKRKGGKLWNPGNLTEKTKKKKRLELLETATEVIDPGSWKERKNTVRSTKGKKSLFFCLDLDVRMVQDTLHFILPSGWGNPREKDWDNHWSLVINSDLTGVRGVPDNTIL